MRLYIEKKLPEHLAICTIRLVRGTQRTYTAVDSSIETHTHCTIENLKNVAIVTEYYTLLQTMLMTGSKLATDVVVVLLCVPVNSQTQLLQNIRTTR